MMNTGVCLKFARSPNLIFKSQTRKYSNIQKNKNKKEPKNGGNYWRKQIPQSIYCGLGPRTNEITVEVKGMVRAKVIFLMLILLLAIFSPACTRPLLIEERTRRTQSRKNFPKPTYSWTSRPNVPGWLMRAADQTKTKNAKYGICVSQEPKQLIIQ